MKARYIYTKIWRDGYVTSLSLDEKLSFFYLLTNEQVNKCGIYELPDKYITFELDITQERLDQIKQKFSADRKFLFFQSWIYIINYFKYNTFSTAPNIIIDFKREFDIIPKHVKAFFFDKKNIAYQIPFKKNNKIKLLKQDTDIVYDIDIESSVGGSVGVGTNEDIEPDEIPI